MDVLPLALSVSAPMKRVKLTNLSSLGFNWYLGNLFELRESKLLPQCIWFVSWLLSSAHQSLAHMRFLWFFTNSSSEAPRRNLNSTLVVIFHKPLYLWSCDVVLGGTTTLFLGLNVIIHGLVICYFVFMLVYLLVVSTFQLISPQIQNQSLDFFHECLLLWTCHLTWRLTCHSGFLQQLVGILCWDHDVRAQTSETGEVMIHGIACRVWTLCQLQ